MLRNALNLYRFPILYDSYRMNDTTDILNLISKRVKGEWIAKRSFVDFEKKLIHMNYDWWCRLTDKTLLKPSTQVRSGWSSDTTLPNMRNPPPFVRVPLLQLPGLLLLHELVGPPQHLHDLVDPVGVVALLEVRPHLVIQGFQREQDGSGQGRTTGRRSKLTKFITHRAN